MAYLLVDNFRAGMDRRNKRISGKAGTLWTGKNGHITRGGDWERRKKFVSAFTLPTGTTKGLAITNGQLFVFGASASPGTIPTGVTYQRLQHPTSGSAIITLILSVTLFSGKLYVIAEFDDGNIYHYYDGVRVTAWDAVSASIASNNAVASALAVKVDLDPAVSATAIGSVVTITSSTPGTSMTVVGTAFNGGGVNDQTLTVVETQANVAGVSEVVATGTLTVTGGTTSTPETLAAATITITGGTSDPGVDVVSSITANGVEILGASIDWTTSNSNTAQLIVNQINSYNSTPEYTASRVGTTITINPIAGTGATPNGYALGVTVGGTVTKTDSGTFSGGVTAINNDITSIKVDGIEILSVTIPWTTSNSNTAELIKNQINTYNSSPEYTATRVGSTVTISAAAGTGTTPNGLVIATTKRGNLTETHSATMTGGVAAVAAVARIVTATVGGTFEAGDVFTLQINSNSYSVSGGAAGTGTMSLTFQQKVYSVTNSLLYFTALNAPADLSGVGSGFINIANQNALSEILTGIGEYQGRMAIFSRSNITVYKTDVDPALNIFQQSVPNTGTLSPRSIIPYGNIDVFYLDDSGIRSLRARDSSNSPAVNDVGVSIDTFVRDYIATLTEEQLARAMAIIEPIDGRYWLAMGKRIFVFSYFPGSKINAWSYYDLTDEIGADEITEIVRTGRKTYLRAGDKIYLYGGNAGATYPNANEIECLVELPFMAASTPATFKGVGGFDIAAEGTWKSYLLTNPNDESTELHIGDYTGITYQKQRNVVQHPCAVFALRLSCVAAGYASVSGIAVHYHAEDAG
jgi:hypothetical protein